VTAALCIVFLIGFAIGVFAGVWIAIDLYAKSVPEGSHFLIWHAREGNGEWISLAIIAMENLIQQAERHGIPIPPSHTGWWIKRNHIKRKMEEFTEANAK
jgi:hypothetical protein